MVKRKIPRLISNWQQKVTFHNGWEGVSNGDLQVFVRELVSLTLYINGPERA